MRINFLDVFDQIRYMDGLILTCLIFMANKAQRRTRFIARIIEGLIVCNLVTMTYLPIKAIFYKVQFSIPLGLVSGSWWLATSFLVVGYMLYCYDISVCSALVRGIFGQALQLFITAVLRCCIVGIWFPGFPNRNPFLYIVVTVAVYGIFLYLAYYLLARKMYIANNLGFLDNRKMLYNSLGLIGAFSFLSNVTMGIFDYILPKMRGSLEFDFYGQLLQYFCIGMLILVSVIVILLQYNIYEISFLQQEKDILKHLQVEKERHYQYTRENIDLINQKSHDLKHLLHAFDLANNLERDQVLAETKEAVKFFDYVVETNNKVLDTILTEKGMICKSQNIRLTCTVKADNLGKLAVMDLYTILANALDNAIECVKQYEDDKKIINVLIKQSGTTICMMFENYFDGKLEFIDGNLITSKSNKDIHGFGVKSIQMLTKKYGGDIRISTINNVFSLQLMIPV